MSAKGTLTPKYCTCEHCGGAGKLIDWRIARELREQAGIRLTDFALKNMVSPTQVSDVERGKKRLNLRLSRLYEDLYQQAIKRKARP